MTDLSFLEGALLGLSFLALWAGVEPPAWAERIAGSGERPGALALRQGWGWWPLPVLFSFLWSTALLMPALVPHASGARQAGLGCLLGCVLLALWRLARLEQDLRLQGRGEALIALTMAKILPLLILTFLPAPGPLLALLLFAAFCLMALMENGPAMRRMEARRQEAQDAAWRSRLAPHFIFNVLNTLGAQIARDPGGAQATTEHLGRLFRQLLSLSQRPTVSLAQELAFVEDLLALHRARLGPRLRVSLEIPEELESLEVPTLALQTLVENALKHGVEPLETGGEIRVRARTETTYGGTGTFTDLLLTVENPVGGSAAPGTGTGLESLRARLRHPEDLVLGGGPGTFTATFLWRQP